MGNLLFYSVLIVCAWGVKSSYVTSASETSFEYAHQPQSTDQYSQMQIPEATENIVTRSFDKGQYHVGQYFFTAPDGFIYWVRYIYDESGFHPELGLYQSAEVFSYNSVNR